MNSSLPWLVYVKMVFTPREYTPPMAFSDIVLINYITHLDSLLQLSLPAPTANGQGGHSFNSFNFLQNFIGSFCKKNHQKNIFFSVGTFSLLGHKQNMNKINSMYTWYSFLSESKQKHLWRCLAPIIHPQTA